MRFYSISTGPIGGLNCEVYRTSTGPISGLTESHPTYSILTVFPLTTHRREACLLWKLPDSPILW